MDFTTIGGIVAGFILIVYGIGVGSLGNFWDFQSVVIVVFGTFAALIGSFPFEVMKKLPSHFKIISKKSKSYPAEYIDTIVEFAQIARKNGLLALEDKANEQEDPFMKNAVLLIVDAIDADKIRAMLDGDIDYLHARHEEAVSIYEKGASLAPAFGMIGTLIGLINMLKSMDLGSEGGGADGLGEGMSVALITTFYGTIMANVIFTPIANKLRSVHAKEILCKEIIVEGVLSIQAGENPKYIKEKLVSFLSQKEREMVLNSEGGGGEEGADGKKAKKPKKEKKEKASKE